MAQKPGGTKARPKGELAKAAIMEATFRVIVQQGVHQLSMQDVAEQAEVSKALVHYHYGTKQNLLCQAASWGYENAVNRTVDAVSDSGPDGDPLAALVSSKFYASDDERPAVLAYHKLLDFLRDEGLLGGERDADYFRLTEAYYAGLVREGIAAGRYDCDDPEAAAADMRAVMTGTFGTWLREPALRRDECAARCRRLLALVVGERPQRS